MAPIRTNRQLILDRKLILDRIEKQSKIWIIFSFLSFLSIFGMAMAISVISSTVMIYSLIVGISIVSISWWLWTMKFILETTRNQKIIYKLLQDIYFDIETIRVAIDQDFKDIDIH